MTLSDFLPSMDLLGMALRVFLAMVAGGLVGLERYQRGHPAGMRTFSIVCMTSALLTVSLGGDSTYSTLMGTSQAGGSRVVQGILGGIGFIGAGVIVREGLSIRGLTSAASIWAVSAIGILIGSGEVALGFIGAALVLLILAVFRWIDRFVPRRSYSVVHATYAHAALPDEKRMVDQLEGFGFRVLALSFKGAKSGTLDIRASVWAPGATAPDARERLALAFQSDPRVVDFAVEPASTE